MAHTSLQTLRWMQAKNRGLNQKIAKDLRKLATMLEKKGTGEFIREEIHQLIFVRKALATRLEVNAMAASTKLMLEKGIRRMKVKVEI